MLLKIKKKNATINVNNKTKYSQFIPVRILLSVSGPMIGLIFVLATLFLRINGIMLPEFHAVYLIIVIYSVFTSNIIISLVTASLESGYYIFSTIFFDAQPLSKGYNHLSYIINTLLLYMVIFIIEYMKVIYENKSTELIKSMTDTQNAETALQLTEIRLKTITDNMTDIILQTNYYGIYQYVSPSCESITGYTPDELIGTSYLERVHPEDVPSVIRIAKNADKSNSSHTIFHRYIRKDGNVIWMETSGSPLLDNDGNIIGAVFCARDITDRLHTQIALQESEEKFRELFNHATDAIFLYEFTGYGCYGNIIEVNDVACLEYGYTKEEFSKMSTYDIVYDKDFQLSEDRIKAFSESGNLTYEKLLTSKSGSIIPFELNSHVFELNGKKVVLTIARNISDRKQAELALKQSEALLINVVKNIPSYLIVTDINLKISIWNKIFENAIDIPSIDIIGSNILDAFPLSSQNNLKELLNAVIKTGESLILNDYPVIYSNMDNKVYYNIRASSFNDSDGKTAGLIVTCDDITALHESEDCNRKLYKTIELDRLRTEFFANISHEFRTPLNVILATLQLIEKIQKHQSCVEPKYLQILKQNCYRLLRLVNNLIDITRIDSGFYELHLKNCNIVSIIEDITLSVANYIENKGINLTFDTDTEELTLACDPDKIERIILNLLSNAIKFTKPGGEITVTIEAKSDTLAIVVSDTGIGIPTDMTATIFERFRQVNKSMTRESEGSGIGLSLVRSLVELHGGTISLTSQLGKGSSFIIELPINVLKDCDEMSFQGPNFNQNQTIERINIEFSDIYQSRYQSEKN